MTWIFLSALWLLIIAYITGIECWATMRNNSEAMHAVKALAVTCVSLWLAVQLVVYFWRNLTW